MTVIIDCVRMHNHTVRHGTGSAVIQAGAVGSDPRLTSMKDNSSDDDDR